MKKITFWMCLLMVSIFGTVSCTEEETPEIYPNQPRSAVPDELVGYWLNGTSSITNFWGYNGAYQGAAYELALGYQFYKDGRAREYFYYTNTSYNCRSQVLGYKEGTVEIDLENNTIKFYPADGNYRSYNTCSSSQNGATKIYGASELYPAKSSTYRNIELIRNNGQVTSWRVPYSDGSVGNYQKSQEPQK